MRSSIDGAGAQYGVQGGIGSFNEDALFHYLQSLPRRHDLSPEIAYLYTTRKVLAALEQFEIDYGLFAIYNSVGGFVKESIQAAAEYKFRIVQQVAIPIEHCLMTKPGVPLRSINTIMTHPQVLRQCAKTLSTRYGDLMLTSGTGDLINTAGAAQAVAAGDLPETTAVMGSRRLSSLYDLTLVDESLQDDADNQTCFWLVARHGMGTEPL